VKLAVRNELVELRESAFLVRAPGQLEVYSWWK